MAHTTKCRKWLRNKVRIVAPKIPLPNINNAVFEITHILKRIFGVAYFVDSFIRKNVVRF